MARRRGSIAALMKSLSRRSPSSSLVCGLGTFTSAISSSLARSREMRASSSALMAAASIGSRARRRQPDAAAFLERAAIEEMRQRDVLRDQAGGVDQDALVVALAALLLSGHHLVDLGMELLAREQAGLDRAPELALKHVELPAVDHDLVHLRPAGRIELAPRQRDEGAARLEPRLAAHDLA